MVYNESGQRYTYMGRTFPLKPKDVLNFRLEYESRRNISRRVFTSNFNKEYYLEDVGVERMWEDVDSDTSEASNSSSASLDDDDY